MLYEDKDYVKWILEHLNSKTKVMAFGMKEVLVLPELRMKEDYPLEAVDKSQKEPAQAAKEKGGANKPGNSSGKSTGQTGPDNETGKDDEKNQTSNGPDTEMSEEERTERAPRRSTERLETALGTIIQELQRPAQCARTGSSHCPKGRT